MKTILLVAILGLIPSAGYPQGAQPKFTPPVDPAKEVMQAPDANAAWKLIRTIDSMESAQALPPRDKPEEREIAVHQLFLKLLRHSLGFYQRFPSDPRRWEAIANMSSAVDQVITKDGAPQKGIESKDWNATAWLEWRSQLRQLRATALTAPDAPEELKLSLEASQDGGLRSQLLEAMKAAAKGEAGTLPALRAEILRLAAKYPTAKAPASFLEAYMQLRMKTGASKDDITKEWKGLEADSSPVIRAAAQKALKQLNMLLKPLDLSFTSADGRPVDLAKLRGKVVLVDFWATWCGPCRAELPNVKTVYGTYHDKGFEVVGIALEDARLSKADTPEKTAEKMAKAKQALLDFTTKNEMPWPQYFDGKFWNNDISKRFSISAIPAMFLLDKDGKVVTTSARGKQLEIEVKRLLGIK